MLLQEPLYWLSILVAFLLGLFIGKNNASKVQQLGEVAEKDGGAIISDIKDKIEKP